MLPNGLLLKYNEQSNRLAAVEPTNGFTAMIGPESKGPLETYDNQNVKEYLTVLSQRIKAYETALIAAKIITTS